MAKTKFTADQQKVIDYRGNNLLVSAAAGSGKTAVLTQRILAKISDQEHPVDIDHLLIVTFTKAAAAEMRERIGKEIAQYLEEHPEDVNMQRQQTLLYNAQITTIDSFCLFIIRNNFSEIGLDPGFRPMDDGEGKLMKQDVLDELLEAHYAQLENLSSENSSPENSSFDNSSSGNSSFENSSSENSSSDAGEKNTGSDDIISSQDFAYLIETFGDKNGYAEICQEILRISEFANSHPFPEDWLENAKKDFAIKTEDEFLALPWMQEHSRVVSIELEQVNELINEGIAICQENGGPDHYLPYFQEYKDYVKNICSGKGYQEQMERISVKPGCSLSRKRNPNALEENKERAKKVNDTLKKKLDKIRSTYFPAPIQEIREEHNESGRLAKTLLSLTEEFMNAFTAKKREKNVVDFSDMEHLALEILLEKKMPGQQEAESEKTESEKTDSETTESEKNFTDEGTYIPSKVALEYQEYFEEVMVDEYQDSNYVQEYILKSVTKGSNYFMVGDVKQSIYRFRLAKPEIFIGKYDTFSSAGDEQSGCPGVKIDLNRNFRSRAEVLDSVNDVFETIMRKETCGIAYDDQAKLYAGADYQTPDQFPVLKDGMSFDGSGSNSLYQTEVLLLDKEEVENRFQPDGSEAASNGSARQTETDGANSEKIPKKKSDKTENNQSEEKEDDDSEAEENLTACEGEAWLISSKIRELLVNHFPVTDTVTREMRPIQYGDIVILLRGIDDRAEAIKNALECDGIPVSIPLKTGYFSAMEVKTVLNYLKVLDNSTSDIPLFGSMVSFFGKFSEEEMAVIKSGHREMSIYDAVKAYETEDNAEISILKKLDHFWNQVKHYRLLSQYVTIHDLIRSILLDTGYMNYMAAMPGGERRKANLQILLERASSFEQTSYHGLFQFIRYIELLKEKQVDFGEADTVDENANVVRIMTIHKSKGLEFPVCFVSGLGKNINKQDSKGKLQLDSDYGVGLDYFDLDKRIQINGFKKNIMGRKTELDSLAEEMRILYVAMTRAKEKLYLTGIVQSAENLIAKYRDKNEIGIGDIVGSNSLLQLLLIGFSGCRKINHYVRHITLEELEDTEIRKQLHAEEIYLDLNKTENPNPLLVEQLQKQMEFTYRYPKLQHLYTKTSVSELKKAAYEQKLEELEYQDTAVKNVYEPDEIKAYIPDFIRKETDEQMDSGAGARRGTAYHRIMELFPFEQLLTSNETLEEQWKASVRKDVKEGKILPEDAELVAIKKCKTFLQTNLAERMAKAAMQGRLYKEQPFFLGVPANELDSEFPSDETIIVQGVIDAYFVEDGQAVIMDYKTDQVASEEELINRYRIQLEIYARAVEQITGKKVKELIIYSFCLGKEIIIA